MENVVIYYGKGAAKQGMTFFFFFFLEITAEYGLVLTSNYNYYKQGHIQR